MLAKNKFLKKAVAMVLSCAMIIAAAPLPVFATGSGITASGVKCITEKQATIKDITSSSVTIEGTVDAADNATVTKVHLDYWPAQSSDKKDREILSSKNYSFKLDGLIPKTLYNFEITADYTESDDPTVTKTASAAIPYTFSTTAIKPTLRGLNAPPSSATTDALFSVSYTSGDLEYRVKEGGFAYSTASEPRLGDSGTVVVTGVTYLASAFEKTITFPEYNKTYYVVAYIKADYKDKEEIFYSDPLEYTTPTVTVIAPSVSTSATLSDRKITVSGTITNLNNGTVANGDKGILYSTGNSAPEYNGANVTPVTISTNSNTFSTDITVSPGVTYYVRAYAKNSLGQYGYGPTYTVYVPNVTTGAVSASGATISVTTSYTNHSAILKKGFVWSTSSNAALSSWKEVSYTGSSNPFTSSYSGSNNTTYYIRSFAETQYGKTYGDVQLITTTTAATTIPTVSMASSGPVSFSDGTLTLKGALNNAGGGTITANGFVYSTSNSTAAKLQIGQSGTSSKTATVSGAFSTTLSVSQGSTYYVRAYATNSRGTGYSSQIYTVYVPKVTTGSVSVSGSTVSVTTSYTTNSAITRKGIVYSTSSSTALSNWTEKTYTGSSSSFTLEFSDSTSSNRTYYIRSFVKTEYGTSYGERKSITFNDGTPSVTTDDITNIDSDSARIYINVTSTGGYSITERGIVYSATDSTPTLSTSKTEKEAYSGTTGRDYEIITGLEPDTRYYVRAYARNSRGTSYGNVKNFRTTDSDAGDDNITTVEVIDITGGGATLIGHIYSTSGAISEKGFVYGKNTNPTTSNGSQIISTAKTTGRYSLDIDDLDYKTTYYARAYVKTTKGTSYGKALKFTTTDAASARTTAASSVQETSATLNGSVNNPSNYSILEKGFVYSDTNTAPTISNRRLSHSSTAEGTYSMNIADLAWNTVYYYRAYVRTSQGTTYGRVQQFTTKASTGKITINFKTLYGVQVKTQTITADRGETLTQNDLNVPTGYSLYEPTWRYTVSTTDSVNILVTKEERAFMEGVGGRYFAPDQATTRAEVAQIIYNLSPDKTTESAAISFDDVPMYHAAEKAIEYCSAKGYMNGFPDGTFRPNDKITRVQMAVVLTKVYELSGSPSANFTDVTPSYWGYNYIALVSANNMMNGYPNGTFGFDNTTTRAEVCTLFSNAEKRTLEPLGTTEFIDVPSKPEEHWAYKFIMNAAIPE